MSWSDEMARIHENPERHGILRESEIKESIEYPYFKCLLLEHLMVEQERI